MIKGMKGQKGDKSRRSKRKTILEQIETEEGLPQFQTVKVSFYVMRGLHLHALRACRDGDYMTVGDYVSDLIRRDKHIKNSKPPGLDRCMIRRRWWKSGRQLGRDASGITANWANKSWTPFRAWRVLLSQRSQPAIYRLVRKQARSNSVRR